MMHGPINIRSTIAFVMSLCQHGTPLSHRKFHILLFFENLSIKIKFHLILTRITGTLHEDLFIFTVKYLAEIFLKSEMLKKKQ